MENTKYEAPALIYVSVGAEDVIATSSQIGVEGPIRTDGDAIWSFT